MSKRKRQTRTATVSVPEIGEVIVRGPTDKEVRGDGSDISTPEKHAEVLTDIITSAVISPKLTPAQVRGLSEESVEQICEARLRLHPKTAVLLSRIGR